MTKVQATFKFSRHLTDDDLKNISRIHSIYGILAARVLPPGNELFVEYDASRLSRKEVQGILDGHGLPLT